MGPTAQDRRGDDAMNVPMRVVDTDLMSARRNIAVTAAMAELHRAGLIADTLRFSTYPNSVLLGCDQRLLDVVRVKACRRRHVNVARRVTGGDGFYTDAGVLIWDLVSERRRFSRSPGDVREYICSGLVAGLRRFGLPVQCRPLGRIEIDGRTIAASSGSVDGPIGVFQGMVLIDPDFDEATAVLREPHGRKDETRARLSDRMTTLSEWLGRTPSMHELKSLLLAGLAQAWRSEFRADRLSAAEQRLADRLLDCGIGAEPFAETSAAMPSERQIAAETAMGAGGP